MKIIVTAGGQGTKLWPYSREHKPKQFQTVVGDSSLYTQTIDTLLKEFEPEVIFISTKRKFIKYVSDQSPKIPLKNYIIEPDLAKDRGPGEGLAFLRLSVDYPDEPFFLVQADCVRSPETAFLQMIKDAEKVVKRDKLFLTGGIKATEPTLGIDYLRLGARIEGDFNQEVYKIDEFAGRKDSIRETRELIENYHIVAHCNHYCWYPEMMLDAYKKHRPDWHKSLMEIKDWLNKPGEDAAIERIYAEMEKGPTEDVTKHIMPEGGVILLPFRWTDIGTWGSIYDFFTENEGSNYEDGKVLSVNTTGSLIKSSSDKKLVAVAGVEDMVIVDTDDILLVIPKDKIEKIKDLQKLLAESDDRQYL
jgi:mannose-1-phosphate guanylyltransferase